MNSDISRIAAKVSAASSILAEAYAELMVIRPVTLREQTVIRLSLAGLSNAQLKTEKQVKRLRRAS